MQLCKNVMPKYLWCYRACISQGVAGSSHLSITGPDATFSVMVSAPWVVMSMSSDPIISQNNNDPVDNSYLVLCATPMAKSMTISFGKMRTLSLPNPMREEVKVQIQKCNFMGST